jgi:hypothetical protein
VLCWQKIIQAKHSLYLYQLFDNSSFMSCDSNGDRSLPVKMVDGRYHVPGRLVMVSREEFREL